MQQLKVLPAREAQVSGLAEEAPRSPTLPSEPVVEPPTVKPGAIVHNTEAGDGGGGGGGDIQFASAKPVGKLKDEQLHVDEENMDILTWLTASSSALAVYAPVFEEAGYEDVSLLRDIEDDQERQELLSALDNASIKRPHRRRVEKMLQALVT